MADIRLFRLLGKDVSELESRSVAVEKSLQDLIERHLETFLGVRLLASEYSTGKTHGGRIDTLGIDENNCPVIIEYKRSLNENVINQGLYYLNWLLDHKAEVVLLVRKIIGPEVAESIEWTHFRLICIAGDFTKYDEHAVQQMNRDIQLIRYRCYGDELLLFDLVNAMSGPESVPDRPPPGGKPSQNAIPTVSEKLEKCSTEVKDRFEVLKAFLLALGDDVQLKTFKGFLLSNDLRALRSWRLNMESWLCMSSRPFRSNMSRVLRGMYHI